MTDQPSAEPIRLDLEQAASLARLLREIEQFLDESDKNVEEALPAHFGLSPACEAFSAALCLHSDTIEAALASMPAALRTLP